MAVTFKRLTKFHPYEPAKCDSFVVGEHEWDSLSYSSVRHHPCFFIGTLLCPLYFLFLERRRLLLHNDENFVCCVKCPRWQQYEGACCSPKLNYFCNALEILLCPVCSIDNNRHTIRKYYNLVEEPQLRCLRGECQCSNLGFGGGAGGDLEDPFGPDAGHRSTDEEGAKVDEQNSNQGQSMTWIGMMLMTVLQNPASCFFGCFGYLACLGCRLLHIPVLLVQHHHELTELRFPHYRGPIAHFGQAPGRSTLGNLQPEREPSELML